MGLSGTPAEILVSEHTYKRIQGDVLLIGRQNTDILPDQMTRLLALYGLTPQETFTLQAEGQLKGLAQSQHISDVSVFRCLGPCKVMAIDVSDYEGAEIVHDLSTPISSDLRNRFDFIYDGSSLDNIFNASQALVNMSEMLRPGGRILLFNAVNSVPTAYLKFSADWFVDFFTINDYTDCKAYVAEFPIAADPIPARPEGLPPQGGCIWHYDPFVYYGNGGKAYQCSSIEAQSHQYCYVIAEKGIASTSDKLPVQVYYRAPEDRALYVRSAERFRSSPRPLFRSRTGVDYAAPSISTFDVVHPISQWTLPRDEQPKQPEPRLDLARSIYESRPLRFGISEQRTADYWSSEILKSVAAELRTTSATLSDISRASIKCDKLSQELLGAHQELEAILSSRSWRYTAPLRNVFRRLRGG